MDWTKHLNIPTTRPETSNLASAMSNTGTFNSALHDVHRSVHRSLVRLLMASGSVIPLSLIVLSNPTWANPSLQSSNSLPLVETTEQRINSEAIANNFETNNFENSDPLTQFSLSPEILELSPETEETELNRSKKQDSESNPPATAQDGSGVPEPEIPEASETPDTPPSEPASPTKPEIEPIPEGVSEPSVGDAPSPPSTEAKPQPSGDGSPEATPPEATSPDAEPADEPAADLPEGDRQQILMEADRLWQQGRFAEAEQLYRKAKLSYTGLEFSNRPEPFYDPAQLSPAGQVYWREAQAGQDLNLATRIIVPLELLTEEYPQFIPGHVRLTEVLLEQGQPEAALDNLERAATLYPDQPELIRVRATTLAEQEQWLEASIAARQFATLYPDDPMAPEFAVMAEEYLDEFKGSLRRRLTGNAIANLFTGALGYALTGGLFGPLSAIESAALLLRGESAVGENIANRATRQLELMQDEEVVAYVNDLGQRLASVAGRDEFEYEFYVVQENELNAFALPGGKIFINAGAITRTNSEAELAGLIAHELAHAVLSHGFQLVTEGNLTANLFQFVPYGGYAANLAVLSYSRSMERQADALGTRMLAASGYAADGLQNLMVTLEEEEEGGSLPFTWLSTHPDTDERIGNIETLITRNGYNRYAYEGVERHQQIRERVEQLMGDRDDEKVEPAN